MPDETPHEGRKQKLFAAVPNEERQNLGLVTASVYGENTPENRNKLISLLFFAAKKENFSFKVRGQKEPDGVIWREPVLNKQEKRRKVERKRVAEPIDSQTEPANIDALNVLNQRIQALRRMSQLFTEPQRVGAFISEVDNLIIKLLTK